MRKKAPLVKRGCHGFAVMGGFCIDFRMVSGGMEFTPFRLLRRHPPQGEVIGSVEGGGTPHPSFAFGKIHLPLKGKADYLGGGRRRNPPVCFADTPL